MTTAIFLACISFSEAWRPQYAVPRVQKRARMSMSLYDRSLNELLRNNEQNGKRLPNVEETLKVEAKKVKSKPYVAKSFANTVGKTPLVELTTITPKPNVKILLKCEFKNPGMSIKDRIAEYILDQAEQDEKIKPGGTVVVASSGNTAAAFAMLCSVRGYKCVAITNEKCSDEKVNAFRAYGAEVIVTKSGLPPDHPDHYQNIETRLVNENPGWFGVDQYDNPLNPEAYYCTIAPEIWEQSNRKATHFVAAASTGGTVSGIGKYLKEVNPGLQVICPDPYGSIFYEFWASQGRVLPPVGSFEVEGVGKDSIPGNLNCDLIDAMPRVEDRDAFAMCRRLSTSEGLLCGGSTGVNVFAAVELAKTLPDDEEFTIVCVAPDSGVKYLSKIYNDAWLEEKGLLPDHEDVVEE